MTIKACWYDFWIKLAWETDATSIIPVLHCQAHHANAHKCCILKQISTVSIGTHGDNLHDTLTDTCNREHLAKKYSEKIKGQSTGKKWFHDTPPLFPGASNRDYRSLLIQFLAKVMVRIKCSCDYASTVLVHRIFTGSLCRRQEEHSFIVIFILT